MRLLKRIALTALAIAIALFSGCRLTPIEAKKIEDICGTYSLTEYYAEQDGQVTELKNKFEYFYLVVSSTSLMRVVYRAADVSDEEYVSTEYSYTCKYKSGSTEQIEEIKLRFNMPFAGEGEEIYVNYFTVSPGDTLVCQKFTYSHATESGVTVPERIVYLKLTRVAYAQDCSYIENVLGFNIDESSSLYSSR